MAFWHQLAKQKNRSCRWFQESVFSGLPELELPFYCDEAWFTLSGYVRNQNNIIIIIVIIPVVPSRA
jgi:hypothetical protein